MQRNRPSGIETLFCANRACTAGRAHPSRPLRGVGVETPKRDHQTHREDLNRNDLSRVDQPGRTAHGRRRAEPMPRATRRAERSVGVVVERLEATCGAARIALWFHRNAKIDLAGSRLVVTVYDQFWAEMVEKNFGRQLRDITAEVLGSASSVEFAIDPSVFGIAPTMCVAPTRRRATPLDDARPERDERSALERFIVGESNRAAFQAAEQICGPGTGLPARRLFLHGPCGVGKTHLLRGIVRRVREQNPKARIRYVPAETFTNEFIQDMQGRRGDQFRRRHRDLDLLCIDDVHFLSKKSATQDEFLHTLDAIDLAGARLVLASDEHPMSISSLDEALASRFVSGVVARISTPDAALRLELTAQFSRRMGLGLEPDAARLFASDPDGKGWTARLLEGRLATLYSACAAHEVSFTGLTAAAVTRLISRPTGGVTHERRVRTEEIRDEVCRVLEIQAEELGRSGRQKRVVLARGMITLIAKRMNAGSYPEIARCIGKSNHSTVITARQKLEASLDEVLCHGLGIDGMTKRQLADRLTDHFRAGR